MRHRLSLVLLLTLQLGPPVGVVRAQQKVDIQRAASPTVSVRLGGAVSSLRIVGWAHDSISLTGALGAGSRMEGSPLRASGPITGIKLFVEAADETALRENRLELRVPRNARVWVKAGSADLDASGVTGGLDLNIVGGEVRVSGGPRELLVESMDGSVTISGGASYARLKTATGDIALDGRGEDVMATTVSGAIRLGDGVVERGRFESVTGPITFSADLAPGGDVRFDTHSGPVELRLARRVNADIDVASITGSIENALTSNRPARGREGRGMELAFSSGTGAAHVLIRSFKGNVRLMAK